MMVKRKQKGIKKVKAKVSKSREAEERVREQPSVVIDTHQIG